MTEAMFRLVVADPVDTTRDGSTWTITSSAKRLLPSPRTLEFLFSSSCHQQVLDKDYLRHRRPHGFRPAHR
jgi:hypothetical protein